MTGTGRAPCPPFRQERRLDRRVLVAVLLGAAVGGCGRAADASRLDVYAASSLTDVFADLASGFEAAHPGVEVAVTLAGSQILRLQIEQGAPADVFASADPEHMRALVHEGWVSGVRAFAHNEIVVIVPRADPNAIRTFAELPRARRIVIGTPNVPVGRYAREALVRADAVLGRDFEARVLDRVVSEETNVRLARAKVELGEADAAFVYRTDALGSDRVRIVELPAEARVRASYVIGRVGRVDDDPPRVALAEAWIGWVLGPEGRAALVRHGFGVE